MNVRHVVIQSAREELTIPRIVRNEVGFDGVYIDIRDVSIGVIGLKFLHKSMKLQIKKFSPLVVIADAPKLVKL